MFDIFRKGFFFLSFINSCYQFLQDSHVRIAHDSRDRKLRQGLLNRIAREDSTGQPLQEKDDKKPEHDKRRELGQNN
jgi:hypothetical protein